MKKLGLAALIGIMLFTTGCGCDKGKEENKTKEPEIIANTEENVIKTQEIDGLKITNVVLLYEKGVSSFSADVVNNSGADYNLKQIKISFKDETGKEITNLIGYVGSTIPNGALRTIQNSVAIDLSKIKSIEYSIVK